MSLVAEKIAKFSEKVKNRSKKFPSLSLLSFRKVAKVADVRDRLAFHSVCEECNVVLAESKSIPDIVGIIMSAELGAAAAERAAREAADAAVRSATQAAVQKIKQAVVTATSQTSRQDHGRSSASEGFKKFMPRGSQQSSRQS